MTVPSLADLTEPAPPPGPGDWNGLGVVLYPHLIPDPLVDAYRAEWAAANLRVPAARPEGWPDCTPYMRHEALRAICCYRPLADAIEALIGEPAAVHLNLTGWVTTERDWHQDSYLNSPEVGDFYAAVWVALGAIDPDSGPFQYVPGSHRWPQVTRDRIGAHVDLADPRWPKHSETVLSPLFEREIRARNAIVVTHLPRRGDVLIWHGRLLHRGSKAQVPGLTRAGLIAHYSGTGHRPDFPPAVQSEHGGWYFPITERVPVR